MQYVIAAWKVMQIGFAVYNALKASGVDLRGPVRAIHEAVTVSMATAHTVKEAIEKVKNEKK